MTTQVRPDSLYQIRQSGATLQQIASIFGMSREGIRWRLLRYYGSTRIQGLLTATELARLAGCPYRYIEKLQRRGVIQPTMVVGQGRTLWEPGTVAAVIIHIDRLRCPVCHRPVPSNRQTYCSKECYIEAHRYKNRSKLEKSRHNERVVRWLAEHPEQARQLQQRAQARQQAKRSLERYHNTELNE